MVNTIGSYLINNGYYQQVSAFGASDMEVGWNDPYTTRQWVWGYQNANNWPMYNFGDAQGCPQVRSIPNFNAPCDNGWYQFTIWDISWGISAAFPLPLIYDNDGVNGRQWYSLSAYGYDLQNGRIDIQGVVTQSYACSQRPCNPNVDNTPQEGYMDLNSALTSDPNTFQGIKWSADLGYSGY